MTADDDLCVQLDSLDPSTLWCALIQTGKRNRRDLLHRVEEFLSHPDGYVREAALKVVAFYWKLPEYRDYAMDQVRGDEDPRVREAAAMALGDYGRGDSNVLRRLLEVALDPAEAEDVRDAAYHGALTVAGISRAEYPRAYWRPDWEARADWALLARMVRSCGATVPPRLAELASRPRLITPEEAAEAAAAAVRAGRPAAPPSHLVRLDAATFHATPCEGWQLAEVLLAIEAIRPGLRWYAADVSTAQQPAELPDGRMPRLVGETAVLARLCVELARFERGLFAAVPAAIDRPVFRRQKLFSSDDERADLGDAILEVRARDEERMSDEHRLRYGSHWLVVTRDAALALELARRYATAAEALAPP